MILKKFFLLKLLLIFFIIYDFSLIIFPSLTSGRIALAYVVIHSLFYKNIKFDRNLIVFVAFILILLIASLIQFISSNDFIQTSRLIWFALYSIIAPYLIQKYFKSLEEFLWIFLVATSIQAVIAINSFLNPAVKQFILSFIIVGGNDIEEVIYRAIGFSGVSGSSLSINQFCGVFSGVFLLKYYTKSNYKSLIIWIGIILTLISTLVIGRTGLLFSLFVIAIYLISIVNFKKSIIYLVFIFLISQINFLSILEDQTKEITGFRSDFFTNWLEDAFVLKNNNTVNAINEMPIPPVTIFTILGTGQVFDTLESKNASQNDSGYIQTYYSLGLFLAILFYGFYFVFLLKQFNNEYIYYIVLAIIIMFFIELKEPFIFKYILPFFILNLIFLSRKKETITNFINTNQIT